MSEYKNYIVVQETIKEEDNALWKVTHSRPKYHVYVNTGYGVYEKFLTFDNFYSEESEHLCDYLNDGFANWINKSIGSETFDEDDYDLMEGKNANS